MDTVRDIALTLPGVEESPAYGALAFSRLAENCWHVSPSVARPNLIRSLFAWTWMTALN